MRGLDLLARALAVPDFTPHVTPIEEHDGVLAKREDAWVRGGASGAKARALFTAAEDAVGLVSAGARISPQLERAALVARALDIPARLHTGYGADTAETALAAAADATVLRHRPARVSVIRARYRIDAETLAEQGWAGMPFGMEHPAYLEQVAEQAAQLPRDIRRIVVPVGSGITLAAILRGLHRAGNPTPVLGVRVGGDPTRTLGRHAPGWAAHTTLATSPAAYTDTVPNRLGNLALDPHYEAKTLPCLRPGDLLWTVGVRASALA
ncbi:pyridoxal-phosphate dependent enzyme [Streptomyces fractus]|uniref:pyridoxal-phosphate dependent enzyme n=1 Tax=Streptomyces fractus TaxID=641806 RepID=UPI003CF76BC0